jgi:hypothetical protein
MDSTRMARRIDRAAPYLAAALLALPVVADRARSPIDLFAELRAGRFDAAAVASCRATLDVAGVIAAALLVPRRTRAFAAVFGLVAVIVPASAMLLSVFSPRLRWSETAPFQALGPPWALTTACLLLVVVGRERWSPPRTPRPRSSSRTALDVVPATTVFVGGGALLWFAFMKAQSVGYFKCLDPWAPANVAMTSAEAWTGLLAVFPRTRLAGAPLGAALMTGTALFAEYAWIADIPSKGCHCFGDFDAPWPAHMVVALVVASVLGAAAFRETRIRALRPVEASAPRRGSIVDDARSWIARRRAAGVRFPWAGPIAAVVLLGGGACRLTVVYEMLIDVLLYQRFPYIEDMPHAVVAAAEIASGLWLLGTTRVVRGGCVGFWVAVLYCCAAVVELVQWLLKRHDPYEEFDRMPWFAVAASVSLAALCLLATRTRRRATPSPTTPAVTPRAAVAPRATVL